MGGWLYSLLVIQRIGEMPRLVLCFRHTPRCAVRQAFYEVSPCSHDRQLNVVLQLNQNPCRVIRGFRAGASRIQSVSPDYTRCGLKLRISVGRASARQDWDGQMSILQKRKADARRVYSSKVGRGRVSPWWACASHARGGLHVVRWKQARPSDRRPTRVLACLSPPYIVMNNPG